jgi:hypothetical protein
MFILKNEEYFMSIITHIRFDANVRMTDNQVNQTIQYPNVRQTNIFHEFKFIYSMRRIFDNEN